MKLTIRREAELDIESTFDWYDRQQRSVGKRFVTQLNQVFEQISDNPLLFPEIQSGIHRALTRHFPYAVYYQTLDDEVTVLAILHQRRSPVAWERN